MFQVGLGGWILVTISLFMGVGARGVFLTLEMTMLCLQISQLSFLLRDTLETSTGRGKH